MRRVTVFLPEKLYEEISRLKREGKIRSISEFVRNIVALYLGFQRVVWERRFEAKIEYAELLSYHPISSRPQSSGKVGYGVHHREVVKQLLEVFKKRKSVGSPTPSP